ncbi:MAG TPA: helix-turn-helix domain-containing protein [Steroidobacteraceae bacterium]|nr:helix-turn-helix domain-containing protein [Steroidobacteraceae bacterium]
MAHLETFSTSGLEPRRKIEYWNDSVCASFTPMYSEPVDVRAFMGSIERTSVGDLIVAEVYSDAQAVLHSRSHVARTKRPIFFLHVQLEGESLNRQDGREARLGPGDFTLCDTTRPYEIHFDAPNRMFVLGIPEAILRRHLACPESVVAIPMPGAQGMSGLLSSFLRGFWRQCRENLDPVVVPRVSSAILDLVASAYTVLPQSQSDRSSLATAHRIRIMNYIEAHLGDPDLTPMRVAQACKMTPRYLHHLFSGESETVARYILRRRLEECSRALTVPSQRGRTVTAIAFDYGFNSPTHFGRVFRERYGVTPREYRRQMTAADT